MTGSQYPDLTALHDVPSNYGMSYTAISVWPQLGQHSVSLATVVPQRRHSRWIVSLLHRCC